MEQKVKCNVTILNVKLIKRREALNDILPMCINRLRNKERVSIA